MSTSIPGLEFIGHNALIFSANSVIWASCARLYLESFIPAWSVAWENQENYVYFLPLSKKGEGLTISDVAIYLVLVNNEC